MDTFGKRLADSRVRPGLDVQKENFEFGRGTEVSNDFYRITKGGRRTGSY